MDKRIVDCLAGNHGSYIFPFRWLHGESQERLYEEILAIKNSGIREFCAECRPYPNFCREQWWDDFGFILKTGYRGSESGEMYCKQERFFSKNCKPELENAIAKSPCKVNLANENKGNGLRLDIYYNRKSGKAYAQLFEYVPYTYEPCSCIYEHELSKVNHLISK